MEEFFVIILLGTCQPFCAPLLKAISAPDLHFDAGAILDP